MASHLTAFLPPAPGAVRLRARAVIANGRTGVCLFPHLYAPPLEEKDLADGSLAVVDRLAIDVDVATGELRNAEIPWPALADLGSAGGHLGPGGSLRRADLIVSATPTHTPPPTRAGVAAALAREALSGRPEEVLVASARLAENAELLSIAPQPGRLGAALKDLYDHG
jgi:hypothetical protein